MDCRHQLWTFRAVDDGRVDVRLNTLQQPELIGALGRYVRLLRSMASAIDIPPAIFSPYE
jgi:hypothetical protein